LKKGMVMVLVVGMLLMATIASAQMGGVFGKGKAQFSFGLTHFTAHTVDTLLAPFVGVFNPDMLLLQEHDMLGFGGEFRYGFSEDWAVTLGGFYGFGSDKGDFGPSNGEAKMKYSSFGLRLGLDHTINVTDRLGVYMGPGFEFASARSTFEDNVFYSPAIDEGNPRMTSLSLDGRVGMIAKLGEHFGLNGSMGKKWSYVKKSFDSEIFTFPAEKLEFSRWLSSVNGWAGLVILF